MTDDFLFTLVLNLLQFFLLVFDGEEGASEVFVEAPGAKLKCNNITLAVFQNLQTKGWKVGGGRFPLTRARPSSNLDSVFSW